ncbi:FKBP-type peptidyl-prolyl cis-trans isomerase [Petrachloros mirabilis]
MNSRKKTRITERALGNAHHDMRANDSVQAGRSSDTHPAREVRLGDTVQVDFLAWSEDGSMVEGSLYSEPLIFTTGQNSVMQGMEELVIGMRVGESKTEKILPERAFGPYRKDLSCEVSTSWLQAQQVSPSLGLTLEVRKTDGMVIHMTITDIDGDRVTLDANHRLAGKPIILQLDLLGILDSAAIDLSWNDRSTG